MVDAVFSFYVRWTRYNWGKDNLGIALPTVWRSCLLAPRRMANPLHIGRV